MLPGPTSTPVRRISVPDFVVLFQSVSGVLLYSNFTTFTTGHFTKDAATAAVNLPKGEFYLFCSSASFLKGVVSRSCLKQAASKRLGVAYLAERLIENYVCSKFVIDLHANSTQLQQAYAARWVNDGWVELQESSLGLNPSCCVLRENKCFNGVSAHLMLGITLRWASSPPCPPGGGGGSTNAPGRLMLQNQTIKALA